MEIYLKIVLNELKKHPLVTEVHVSANLIAVKFVTGITENWMRRKTPWWRISSPYYTRSTYRFEFPKKGPYYTEQDIKCYSEFEIGPFHKDKEIRSNLFIYEFSKYKKMKFIDKRIAVHNMLKHIVKLGWQDPIYPQETIMDDWKNINKAKTDVHYRNGGIYLYNKKMLGRHIIESYLPYGNSTTGNRIPLQQAWNTDNLYRAINFLLKKGKDITRHNLVRFLNIYRKAGPRMVHIIGYKAIFEKLGLKPKFIEDWKPDFGGKMLLAASIGADYSAKSHWIGIAKENKICDLIGVDIYQDAPKKPDLIMMDDFEMFSKPKKIKTPTIICSPIPIGKNVKVNAVPLKNHPVYFCLIEP
jgi:hypothetical protein